MLERATVSSRSEKSAEVVVVERQRTESVGVSNMTEKVGMTSHGRKH